MKKQAAIHYFGSQTKLASALGISKQAIRYWKDDVPIGRAFQLEVLTNGALRAPRIHHDVSGSAPDTHQDRIARPESI